MGLLSRIVSPVSPVLALVGFVGLCLLVGAADGQSSRDPPGWYLSLTRPPGTPPNWVFGPVWTGVLYHDRRGRLAGVASHRPSTRPLRLWGWQLAANACWTPAFFALHSPPLAFAVSLVLLGPYCADHAGLAGVRSSGGLADGAVSGVDRLRDLPDRGLLVAQSGLS